jgi:amidase
LPKPQTPAKLKLGLLGEDPAFPLHPPVKRTLANVVKQLEAQGHTIVPIPASRANIGKAVTIAYGFYGLDNVTGRAAIEKSGEPLVESVKNAIEAFGKYSSGPYRSDFLDDIKDLEGVPYVAALNTKRHIVAEEWMALWKELGLDGVIAPPAQSTAVRHDTYGMPPYTTFLNTLDVSFLPGKDLYLHLFSTPPVSYPLEGPPRN